jgi:leucyl aminopeptidase
MNFTLQNDVLANITSDCLILAIYDEKLSPNTQLVDSVAKSKLSAIVASGDLSQAGASILIHDVPGISAKRVALINLGQQDKLSLTSLRKHIQPLAAKLASTKITSLHFAIDEIELDNLPVHLAYAVADAVYKSDYHKTDTKATPHNLTQVSFAGANSADLAKGLEQASAINQAMLLTKKLADLPSNICNPTYMAEQALELAKTYSNLQVDVQSEEQIKAHGMGAFASVSQGSVQDAKLITIEYKGADAQEQPYVIVGKGVTFDTGGISIKPSQSMEEMKYDMCGAASVLGIMQAVAMLKLPINLVGVMGCTENMPGGKASKPGDIVTTMSGQTVEVINTDAEGRLVLCDCLTYVEKYQPKAVIDMATLTGACVVALGHTATGLYANQHQDYPTLGQDLQAAADLSGDKAWLMPLWEEYQADLHSNFADLANCGPRGGAGSISAACFLEKFVNYPWAHLDIAGTAWTSGKNIHATGRPVPMIMNYLINRVVGA